MLAGFFAAYAVVVHLFHGSYRSRPAVAIVRVIPIAFKFQLLPDPFFDGANGPEFMQPPEQVSTKFSRENAKKLSSPILEFHGHAS